MSLQRVVSYQFECGEEKEERRKKKEKVMAKQQKFL